MRVYNVQMTLTVAFLTPAIDYRGTCTALYDYAHYNETLLQNKSIILTQLTPATTLNPQCARVFSDRFPLYSYTNRNELTKLLQQQHVHVLYVIQYGNNVHLGAHDSPITKRVVHCVFDTTTPHGDVYASACRSRDTIPFVPHIVRARRGWESYTLRSILGIPQKATVLGRLGGYDTFNLDWAPQTLTAAVQARSDLYILLMVAHPWMPTHDRIRFLPPCVDASEREAFVRTCDGLLVAETLGHTFGLAIGLFALYEKPILCFDAEYVWNRAHIEELGEEGIYFNTPTQLYQLCTELSKTTVPRPLTAYRRYTPETVMERFRSVFLA